MPDTGGDAAQSANPYVGPKPFGSDERERFCGRDAETRELTSLIVSHREVVLYSQSGAGKTSLLTAGVYPRLKERGFAVWPPARVAGSAIGSTDGDAIANVYAHNAMRSWSAAGTGLAAGRGETLREFLDRASAARIDQRLQIVIFDQFEELFTTYAERWKDRKAFLAQVGEALEANRKLRVVFALREEYVGRFRRFHELFPGNLDQWFYLERLRRDAALEAIRSPAALAGRPYEPEVAEAIVERLLPVRVRAEDGSTVEVPGEFVEPVHLQIVCRRMWEQLQPGDKTISSGHAGVHGDVVVALLEYYEAQIAAVAQETHLSERRLRRWIEGKFVSDDGRRTRVFEDNGRVGGMSFDVAARFQRAYLLRSDAQGDAVWFELAHDRLLMPVHMAHARYRRRVLPAKLAAAAALLLAVLLIGLIAFEEGLRKAIGPAVVSIRTEGEAVTPAGNSIAVAPSDAELITIPVVIHVVYNTNEQNISDAQIDSQFVVLNNDFRGRTATAKNVPEPFQPFVGDAYIEFERARLDPSGNPTNGVTRHRTDRGSFTYDDGVKSRRTGGTDAWPADRYLNVWVTNLGGELMEYSQFPGGPPATDGSVVNYRSFGTIGTATAPFNLGHNMTHSIGHFLNLRHIWGDTPDCSGSDLVDDTPNAAGPNFGSPIFPTMTCDNGAAGDMFMNFMDYVEDGVMAMFTKGQVARMRETLTGPRRGLWKR